MHDLVVRGLEQARNRTLGLTDLDDPTLVTQHDPLMSPLVWDLAHVGQQEELWLPRAGRPGPARNAPASGGRALRRVQAPPSRAPSLPLLPPVEARAYDHEVRGRVLDLIEHTPADELFTAGMVFQHEEQHDETMLATLQLVQGPPVLLGRRPLPPGRDVEPDRVFVGGGPFALGVDAASEPFSLDNERPAHTVDVGPFWIGRVPVSNRQWREFIGDGGYQRQDLWSLRGWAYRTEAAWSDRCSGRPRARGGASGSRRKCRRLSPCSTSATSRPRPTPGGPGPAAHRDRVGEGVRVGPGRARPPGLAVGIAAARTGPGQPGRRGPAACAGRGVPG